MDEIVRKAMEKWPNVPALYGWLGLDRRGRWLLQGKVIERQPLIDFIGRNYAGDEQGRWYFQNGPQRAYIALAYTPWVLRSDAEGGLLAHTGEAVHAVTGAWLDEDGSLLLEWERGIALLDDADLAWAFERLVDGEGRRPAEPELMQALEAMQLEEPATLCLEYAGAKVAIAPIRRSDVALKFGFAPEPAPLEGEKASS